MMDKGRFNILQWNSQSLIPKLVSFEALLLQERVHLALISESWFNSNTNISIRNYNIYRRDRDDSYGGVAIVVHKSVRCSVGPFALTNSGIEVLHVKLHNCRRLENVVSVYCPSSILTNDLDWDELFSSFSGRSLLAGDFNGHHSSWSYKTDSRGIQILDSALENSFIALNDGSSTRVKMVNGNLQQSSPDISFFSTDIAVYFDWRVLNENLGSDHLIVKICMEAQVTRTFIQKRNWKKIDWTAYRNSLSHAFLNVNIQCHDDNIQDRYNLFLDVLHKAIDESVPFVKICTDPEVNFKPREYWNPSLSKSVAQRRLALSSFRRNPTPDNLNKLEKITVETHKLIQRAKANSRHDFLNSIDEKMSASEMWRHMRWAKGFKRCPSIIPLEKQKVLLTSLTPDSVTNCSPTFSSSNELLESDFILTELENCLKRKDSSPGDDEITYSMIYHLPVAGKTFLLYIFNLILKIGYVPDQWRVICILPIPKSGSDNGTDSKLRPISLISCICKIFHLMILKRIEWYVEKNLILSPFAVGFRKANSCTDSLTRLVTHTQIGFTNNVPTLACFLDIKNAYNEILVEKVLSIVDDLGVGRKLCRYLWSFLSNRRLFIKTDTNVRIYRNTNKGLAQGDPLSPLLFNIATYNFCNSSEANISQYADDFVIFASNKNLKYCESKVQLALNCIVDKLNSLGLQISETKTKFCFFSRGARRILPVLYLNGFSLNSVNFIRYLGVWLDRSLSWKNHVIKISEKCSKFLCLLKVLAGSSWGVHPQHLRRLYISLIRSRMDFGCFLFANGVNTHLSKLDKIQNQALRIIGGFIKSSPIHVMESELSLPPLTVRRLYLGYKFTLKSFSILNNVTIELLQTLSSISDNMYWVNRRKPLLIETFNEVKQFSIHSTSPLEMFSLDVWVSRICIKNILNLQLDSVKNCKRSYETNALKLDVIQELSTLYYGWYKLFTDASKCNVDQGAAFYDPGQDFASCYKINQDVSIMTLELIAISQALTYATTLNRNKIVILSDSKSALQHLARCASAYRGVPVAYEVLKKVYDMCKRGVQLRLQWVPSHIGLYGNEVADKWAKSASVDGIPVCIQPYFADLLPKFKILCYSFWKEYFDLRSRDKGIWYKTIQCEPLQVPWFGFVNMNRARIKTLCRIRSGHYPSNKFAHLMKKVSSPNCDVCGTIDDLLHIFTECRKNETERRSLMERFNMNKVDVGLYQSVLANPTSELSKELCCLVTACHQ